MNKKEFLDELREHLLGLPKEDVEEIIEDYSEHFIIGKKKKRNESEISRSLGSPKEIAREVRKELKKNKNSTSFESGLVEFWIEIKKISKNVYFNLKKELPNIVNASKKMWESVIKKREGKKRNATKIIFLSLFNFFVMLWFLISILAIIVSLFLAGISISVAGLVIIITSIMGFVIPIQNSLTTLFFSNLFLGIGIISIGLILSIIFYKLGELFFKLISKYYKFNKRIFGGIK